MMQSNISELNIVEESKEQPKETTRDSLQIGRRLFHMSTGTFIATLYLLLLSHQQLVYILGGIACFVYLSEQIRVSYPEISDKFEWVSKFLLRTEEKDKESGAIPYAMALLLTILTFPKVIALISIYTLAFCDPSSAIFGIKFGKHKTMKNRKSWEGSIAYFVVATIITTLVLNYTFPGTLGVVIGASLIIALLGALMELVPLRLDDNFTIPVFTGIISWITCAAIGLPL